MSASSSRTSEVIEHSLSSKHEGCPWRPGGYQEKDVAWQCTRRLAARELHLRAKSACTAFRGRMHGECRTARALKMLEGEYARPPVLLAPAEAGDAWSHAREVFENRCVVFHGCYDAPCQLELGTFEGSISERALRSATCIHRGIRRRHLIARWAERLSCAASTIRLCGRANDSGHSAITSRQTIGARGQPPGDCSTSIAWVPMDRVRSQALARRRS